MLYFTKLYIIYDITDSATIWSAAIALIDSEVKNTKIIFSQVF